MDELIVPKPLSRRGKNLVLILILGVVGIWLLWIHFFQTFPDLASADFKWESPPNSFGTKFSFALLPLVSSIGPVFILLITKYRFTLINKNPRIINLSTFRTLLNKLPHERRSDWVNRYFEGIVGLVAFLTLYILVIEYGIYEIVRLGRIPSWFIPVVIVSPIPLIVPWLFYLAKFSRDLKKLSRTFPPQF